LVYYFGFLNSAIVALHHARKFLGLPAAQPELVLLLPILDFTQASI
jgi:hypothetical protein